MATQLHKINNLVLQFLKCLHQQTIAPCPDLYWQEHWQEHLQEESMDVIVRYFVERSPDSTQCKHPLRLHLYTWKLNIRSFVWTKSSKLDNNCLAYTYGGPAAFILATTIPDPKFNLSCSLSHPHRLYQEYMSTVRCYTMHISSCLYTRAFY